MLRFNRVGQGLPMSTIILAVLGILVLLIVGVMLSQKSSWFGKSSKNITEQQCGPRNVVQPIGTDCEVIFGSFKDVRSGELCCRSGTVR